MPLKTQVARFDLPKLFEHEESPHEEIEKQLNDLTNKVCHPSPGAPCDLFSHYGHLPRNPGYCWIQHHWDQAARYHYRFNASRFHTNPSIPSAVMTSGTTVVDLGQDHAIEGVDTTITPTHDHFLYLFSSRFWNISRGGHGIRSILGLGNTPISQIPNANLAQSWQDLDKAFGDIRQEVNRALGAGRDVQQAFDALVPGRWAKHTDTTIPFHLAYPQFFPPFYVQTTHGYSQLNGMERLLDKVAACMGWKRRPVNLASDYGAYSAAYRLLLWLFHAWLQAAKIPCPHFDYFVQFLADMAYPKAAPLGLLRRRKALVLYGVPGTGKTHLARSLATKLTTQPCHIHTVQFHPGYSYEDFIIGIRPVVAGGSVTYEATPGKLYEIARDAAQNPDHQVVLIIDEINRADLARVLGEVMYCLEYRGPNHTVTLPTTLPQASDPFAGGRRFYLPENLYLIGTMNHADRSISGFDMALRRRFGWYRMDFSTAELAAMIQGRCTPPPGNLDRYLDRAEKLNQYLSRGGAGQHAERIPHPLQSGSLHRPHLFRRDRGHRAAISHRFSQYRAPPPGMPVGLPPTAAARRLPGGGDPSVQGSLG